MTSLTVSPTAYAKIFLHCSKYPSSNVGGFIIGKASSSSSSPSVQATDAIPMCHYNPCGPMFDIAAEMIEKIFDQDQQQIIGYYYGNESAEAPRPAYIDELIQSIKSTPGHGTCFLVEIPTALLSEQSKICLKSCDGAEIKPEAPSTAKSLNSLVNRLLDEKKHLALVDFEDHMDTASAATAAIAGGKDVTGPESVVADFRNLVISEAVRAAQ